MNERCASRRCDVSLLVALLVGCSLLAGCTSSLLGGRDQGATPRDRGGLDQPRRDGGRDAAPDLARDDGPAPDRSTDPCAPLPAACRCAAACQAGQCDNTRCPCAPIAGVSYGQLSTNQTSSEDPATHVDVNLLLRKTQSVAKTLGLVSINGPTDTAPPPQLFSLFADERVPTFSRVYQVEQWDWGCKCFTGYINAPEVTLAGMTTTPGEELRVPHSGYDMGSGKTALVLYAAPGTITLKYTREDNVVQGYTVHLSGVCIDPKLQALYDQLHAAGRHDLPALSSRQPFGRAIGDEIQAAIRDTGSWMDPRSKKDWWQGK